MAFINGTSGNDIITPTNPDPNFQTTASDDFVSAEAGHDFLDGGSDYDTLYGGSGDDTLDGGNDHYGQRDLLYGEDGNDTLIATGWHGGDFLSGGTGDDTYIVEVYDNGFDPPAPTLTEAVGGGDDAVESYSTWTLGAEFENLTLIGTNAIDGIGNTLNNTIRGNGANNRLFGAAGNDYLLGGAGNNNLFGDAGNDYLAGDEGFDFLVGGVGNDTLHGGITGGYDEMTGQDDNDLYYVDNLSDIVDEVGWSGIDIVNSSVSYMLGTNLENLILAGSSPINGTGNTLGNTLKGNAGNNSLTGGGGNDTLDGGLGSDSLFGGLGNDTYIISSYTTLEVAEENINEGVDTLQSAFSWTLGANQENLTLTGSRKINGTGNTLNNTITGNGANNSLNGNAGNDILTGGIGIDTLVGGTGNDILAGSAGADKLAGNAGKDLFAFKSKTEGRDTITDFLVLDDTIQVSKLGFGGGLTAGAAITTAQFRIGSAAGDSSDRFIYNKANGALLFDADGTGASATVQFAQLSTNLAMTNNDIFVIA